MANIIAETAPLFFVIMSCTLCTRKRNVCLSDLSVAPRTIDHDIHSFICHCGSGFAALV